PSFWPSSSQVVPLAVENLEANLLLLEFAGYPTRMDVDIVGGAREAEPLALHAPNPVAGAVPLAFTLPEGAAARLAVYDLLGREVAVLVDAALDAGRHTVPFAPDRSGLAAGVYLFRLTAGGQSAVRQVTVVR